MTIKRAVAYIKGSAEAEVHVFFEVAEPMLRGLLARLWGVERDDVEFYNCWTAQELIGMATGPQADGDARLLETGHANGKALYCEPQRTLLLLRPAMLARLVRAQAMVERLKFAQWQTAWQRAEKCSETLQEGAHA